MVTRVRWPPGTKPPPNRVEIVNRHKAGKAHTKRLLTKARAFLEALELVGVELCVTLTGDEEIQSLNREWRRKDKPTDVLSFPGGEPAVRVSGEPEVLGDIVISLDTTKRQAKEESRTVAEELDRYLAHGLLHLLGHDHHQKKEAALMGSLEEHLLGGTGMVTDALGAPKKKRRAR